MKNTLKKLRTGVMVSLAGASFMVNTGVSASEQGTEGVVVTTGATTTTENVTATGTEQVEDATPAEAEEVAAEPTEEELRKLKSKVLKLMLRCNKCLLKQTKQHLQKLTKM